MNSSITISCGSSPLKFTRQDFIATYEYIKTKINSIAKKVVGTFKI